MCELNNCFLCERQMPLDVVESLLGLLLGRVRGCDASMSIRYDYCCRDLSRLGLRAATFVHLRPVEERQTRQLRCAGATAAAPREIRCEDANTKSLLDTQRSLISAARGI